MTELQHAQNSFNKAIRKDAIDFIEWVAMAGYELKNVGPVDLRYWERPHKSGLLTTEQLYKLYEENQ